MLKSRYALLFLLFPCAAAAQYPGDEYYPYAEREERRELLTTDSTIFYRAVQSPSDLYGLRTGFNLPQVALRRRGLDYTLERTSLMGVAVSYRYLAALRLLGAEEQRYAGLAAAPGEPAAAGGMRAFRFSDGEPLQPFLASVRFTDRNYLVGAKAAVSASPGDGWRISAALDVRTGRDMHVEGVFTNAVTAGLRLARRFGEGHELSVLCIVPPSVRGTRLSSSEEAFTLTGDRLYNPAWGWQDGRVRNSRVRRETVPLALAAYAVPLSASTSFAATLAAEAGVAKYSMLDWYDARTPMPDNYRYLPSYTGDRFGYDYALTLRGAALRLQADYRSDRFRADLSVVLGSDAVSRRGYYEKELFPGGQSYGPSRVMRFTPYTLKVAAGWAFTPRRYIEIAAAAAARTPRAGDLFFQPLYNNRTVDNPVPERIYAAELNCRLTGPVVDFQAAFFAAMTLDGIETRTYYDDMASVYCDMAVTGVGRMSCGAEAAADIRLSYRWLLSLAASAGRYEYIRDPRVTVLSDVDNSAVDVQAVSRMGGCETGGAPQLTALAEIAWFGPKGWGCRASAGYAGRRYVEPMPLRRTDRIAGQGGITREFFDAFTRQERLPDAFTLDAALFKSFRFERSRLTASLMLRNLTGEADTVYGGYESLRVRRIRPGDDTLYAPHASRCTYAWPRSFYLTISYRF